MKVINLFGGPGTGKSTTAADLFALMKWNNKSVELINEYAKEITWEQRYKIFEDQLYITAKQNRKLHRIKDQVDWAITDSPLLLSMVYSTPDYLPKTFRSMIYELYDTYDNINIFLQREKPYHQVGRNQNEEEARELDVRIKELLEEGGYNYHVIPANVDARQTIYDLLGHAYDL